MSTQIYRIEGPWRGTLGISARPRGGDWLEDEIQAWREAGVDIIVSLLTRDEAREMDLAKEELYTRGSGLEFFSFPIEDRHVPQSRDLALRLVEQLASSLASGKNINIHCRQGIGRSSLIAAALLIAKGVPNSEAVARISAARHVPVPETPEQRDWIQSLVPAAHPTVP
jgi:protein-tyrosine phosphatase